MKQYDVFANPFPRSRERQPFLVALQSDLLLRALDTVVVAPLERPGELAPADRLNPKVAVQDQTFILLTQELVAIRRATLGPAQGSVAAERDAIVGALDLLFTGF